MRNRTFRKDVSDQEVAAHMAPHLSELMRHVVPRELGPDTGGQSEMPESPNEEQHEPFTELSQIERDYLDSVAQNDLLTVTQRRDVLGLTSDAANRIKKRLVHLQLIEAVRINLGARSGGMAMFLDLTEQGWKLLEQEPMLTRPQNVGAEHFWWQRRIAAHLESKGLHSKIEMNRNGKRVDVGSCQSGETVAYEVELRPGNAVRNVLEDLEAGFSKVIVCAKNTRVLAAIRERLQPVLSDEQMERVTLQLLSELPFVKELFRRPVGNGEAQAP